MRLSDDRVREAVLHSSAPVRTAALGYFAEAYSLDPLVMPTAIQAIERYGWEAGFKNRHFLAQLAQSDDTLRWTIGQLQRVTAADDTQRNDLNAVLVQADAEILQRHEPEILALKSLSKETRTAIQERVAFRAASPDDLWQQLEKACEKFGHLDDYPSRKAIDRADRLALALAAHPPFAAERIAESLRENTDTQSWLELYAVRVARHLRLEAAVPWLVARLHVDDDAMLEEAHPALAAIGSGAAIDHFRAAWPTAGWTFRFMAACVLESLHSDRSVETALALAADEPDPGLRFRLYEAAVRNFAPSAVEPGRQFLLRSPWSMDTRQLRASLLAACELMGVQFPEYGVWKKEEEAHSALFARRLSALERAEVVERPIPQGMIVRDRPIVGRNDPCPCGSGKKFKKCCRANT